VAAVALLAIPKGLIYQFVSNPVRINSDVDRGGQCDCFASGDGVMHAVHCVDLDAALIDTRGRHDIGDALLAWLAWLACSASPATALRLLCCMSPPSCEQPDKFSGLPRPRRWRPGGRHP
jgi:hypothetical protein